MIQTFHMMATDIGSADVNEPMSGRACRDCHRLQSRGPELLGLGRPSSCN